ncbi:MAG TPA: AMP-binding protein, partial [Longimicrobiales bacterium]|nr:AMP-binding protein [Longimicrobiales bacterium]
MSDGARYDSVTADALVAEQAARSPDRPAATFGDTSLSYRDLDDVAGRVAARLAARGAGPGRRVGLMIPPGFDRLVSLVGTLRAGAAYVPLDPAYPPARLAR